jgi:1,4-dihydroxy-6-naphthoate synthase
MYYGIAAEKVDLAGYQMTQVLEDIESLNRRAVKGELEVSAVSIHAYAHLTESYALMPCGASMGDGYGPIIVSNGPMKESELAGKTFAIPGTMTSAFLALQLFMGDTFEFKVVPFDKILDAVKTGQVDAGLVIHEGQITYEAEGLDLVADLGLWWADRTDGLPLPLGGNVVRKNLGTEAVQTLTRIIRDSIVYGLENREIALDYALDFGRGLDKKMADRFVGMYVNDLTRDYGDRGRKAIERLLHEGSEAGLVPKLKNLEFVEL